MTKQRHQLKRPKNASTQKGKGVKSNKTKTKTNKTVKPQAPLKLQCEKNQVILEGIDAPCVLISAPEKGLKGCVTDPTYVELTPTESLVSPSPLPHLGWSSCDVWAKIVGQEKAHRRSTNFTLKHPRLQPRMRSIVLDWLMEVSEAYNLHRQTLYLAQDYFDRFMLTQSNVEKSILQLIGVTCLFIASKMEEACPPKLSQMAFVTAGTFYEHEILQMELIILKALRWNLCSETAVSWLKLYFQMCSVDANSDLLQPQFLPDTYVQMTKLLDLCIIDINSMDFEYRVLAAAVLSQFVQQATVEKVSDLSKDVIQPCLNWMVPFTESVRQFGEATLRDFKNVESEDRCNIQTHTDYLTMLDNTGQREENGQLLTPPKSSEKTH